MIAVSNNRVAMVEALEEGTQYPVSLKYLENIPRIIRHFEQASPESRKLCIPISLKFHSIFQNYLIYLSINALYPCIPKTLPGPHG